MSIELEEIRLEGFKSFATPTVIVLTRDFGLKYLSGDNMVDKLGSNGAGKSSVFDAVSWCCHGFSSSGKRASDLLTWDMKQTAVETVWNIDGKRQTISRTSPPERIKINGQASDQAGIDSLLKLSRIRFAHSVIFGQTTTLFYDLSTPERGALLDEIFDLQLWLRAADNAGKRETQAARELREAESDLAYKRGKLEGIGDGEKLKADRDAWDNARADELDEKLREDDALEQEQTRIQATITQAQSQLNKLGTDGDTVKKVEAYTEQRRRLEAENIRIVERQNRNQEQLTLFQRSRQCPTCGQVISANTVHNHVPRIEADIKAARDVLAKNSARINMMHIEEQRLNGELSKLNAKRQHFKTVISEAERTIKTIDRDRMRGLDECDRLVESPKHNPFAKQLHELDSDKRAAQEAVDAAVAEVERISTVQASHTEYWKQGFKRIRLYLLKQVITHLELDVASAASALSLPDWRIKFSTEVETKSGTMRPGVHIQIMDRDKAKPRDWSPGELQRVRLATQLGLASLIQRSAGVYYGFEVYDEPSNWLSSEGIEDLLELLRYRADNTKRSIWLVDQRGLFFSGFAETWLVTKRDEGSSIKMVGRS